MNIYERIALVAPHRTMEDVLYTTSMINFWVNNGRLDPTLPVKDHSFHFSRSPAHTGRLFSISPCQNRVILMATLNRAFGGPRIVVEISSGFKRYWENKKFEIIANPHEVFETHMGMLEPIIESVNSLVQQELIQRQEKKQLRESQSTHSK